MKKLITATFIVFAALSLCMVSCARQPSAKRSQKIIKSYFNKYGKEYPETIYGKNTIDSIEITSQQEVHKHLVAIEAFVTMKDGNVRRIYATIEKGPMGWRFVSWENAS